MSYRPIQAGDLVRVVRACCGGFLGGPSIFEVHEIVAVDKGVCWKCGGAVPGGANAAGYRHRIGVPVPWLRRIPPLSELEGQRTEESLREQKPVTV